MSPEFDGPKSQAWLKSNGRLALVAILSWTGLLLTPTWQAAAHTLRGSVVDIDARPVADARVQLFRSLTERDLSSRLLDGTPRPEALSATTTDARGSFQLTFDELGLFDLQIAKPGFRTLGRQRWLLDRSRELDPVSLPEADPLGLKRFRESHSGEQVHQILIGGDWPTGRSSQHPWQPEIQSLPAEPDGEIHVSRDETVTVVRRTLRTTYVSQRLQAAIEEAGALGPSAGGTLEIQVVDPRKRPVADVVLRLGRRLPLGRTDELGRLSLRFDGDFEIADGGRNAASERMQLVALATDGSTAAVSLGDAFRHLGARQLSPDGDHARGRQKTGAPPLLTLELERPTRVSGRVLEHHSLRPIAGALVWASSGAEPTITDAAGRYLLHIAPEGRTRVRLGATAEFHASHFEAVELPSNQSSNAPSITGPSITGPSITGPSITGPSITGPTFALEAGGRLQGFVRDATGQPVAGALVTTTQSHQGPAPRSDFHDFDPVTHSDSSGRFVLEPLLPHQALLLLGATEELGPSRLTVEPLDRRETRRGLLLELSATRRATGRVVDEERRPVAAAEIRMRRIRRPFHPSVAIQPPVAAADAFGAFSVPGLETDRYEIHVEAEGFAPLPLTRVDVADHQDSVDLGELVLSRGERLEGRVVDDAGQPIAGAEISFMRSTDGLRRRASRLAFLSQVDTTTDSGGLFILDHLTSGVPLTIATTATGFAELNTTVEVPLEEPLTIVLEASASLSGRVFDRHRQPLAGISLRLDADKRSRRRHPPVVSGDDGSFSFDGLAVGAVTLSAEGQGFIPHRQTGIQLEAGSPVEGFEIELEVGHSLAGHVRDALGQPVADADVRVARRASGRVRLARGASDRESERTDIEGFFRLDGLAPGPALIEVRSQELGMVLHETEVETDNGEIEIVFPGGAEVSGTVRGSLGEPLPNASLKLEGLSPGAGVGRTVYSDGDSSFRFRSVEPDRYRLLAEAPPLAVTQMEIEVPASGLSGIDVRVEAGARLTCRVLGLSPSEFLQVRLMLFGQVVQRPPFSELTEQGTFEFEGLAVGDWTVRAWLSGRLETVHFTVEDGVREVEAEIDFTEDGYRITGLIQQDGRVVENAMVFAGSLDSNAFASDTTDRFGRFELRDLPPSTYELTLRDGNYDSRHKETLELTRDTHLLIELSGSSLRGQIINADDATAVADAEVRLVKPSAPSRMADSRIARSDSLGDFSFPSLQPGSYQLEVERSGYVTAEQPVELVAGEERHDLLVELTSTPGLTLELRAPSDSAARTVLYTAVDDTGHTIDTGRARTTSAGRAQLESLPAGSWDLTVGSPGLAPTEIAVTVPGPPVVARLATAGSIALTVEAAAVIEHSRAGYRLYDALGGPVVIAGSRAEALAPVYLMRGAATIGDLAAGTYRVVVEIDEQSWTGTVTVVAGESVELTLE